MGDTQVTCRPPFERCQKNTGSSARKALFLSLALHHTGKTVSNRQSPRRRCTHGPPTLVLLSGDRKLQTSGKTMVVLSPPRLKCHSSGKATVLRLLGSRKSQTSGNSTSEPARAFGSSANQYSHSADPLCRVPSSRS